MGRGRGRKKKRSSGSSMENTPQSKQSRMESYLDKGIEAPPMQELSKAGIDDDVFKTPIKSSIPIDCSSKENETVLKEVNRKLEDVSAIKKELLCVKLQLQEFMDAAKFREANLKDALDIITLLKKENKVLQEKAAMVNEQSFFLKEKIRELDDYSRRENVLISGVPEQRGEDCLRTTRDILSYLGAENIAIQRCHRLGRYSEGRMRDLIFRVLHFPDKIEMMSRRSDLPRGIYLNDDFSPETRRHINVLRPVLRVAKQSDPRAHMVKDRIIHRQKEYSIETVKSIGLNLEKISEKENAAVIAFSGRYSKLSNLHPQPIVIDEQTYKSSEHFYQYQKCYSSGNVRAASKVMLANEPEDAMFAGKDVLKTKEWTETEGRRIMAKALKAKFNPESMRKTLVGTGTKEIREATRNSWWGIGFPFTSEAALSKDKINGSNLMGKLLMELRDEFGKSS